MILTPLRDAAAAAAGEVVVGARASTSPSTTQSIDKDGNTLPIVDDEVELPEDPEGETKVDKLGNLQGGRQYRCRTFKVAGRGDRLYMPDRAGAVRGLP